MLLSTQWLLVPRNAQKIRKALCEKMSFFRRVRKTTAKSDYQCRHVCLYTRLSACNNSAPTVRIFVIF